MVGLRRCCFSCLFHIRKMMRTILLAVLFFPSILVAQQPLMYPIALSCGEINFYRESYPLYPAEWLETFYCSYLVGHYWIYPEPYIGEFSTRENYEGHATWRGQRNCNESAVKTLEILQKNYPNYVVNCSKYVNFDNLNNKKEKVNQ
jgi:hypothetical protein